MSYFPYEDYKRKASRPQLRAGRFFDTDKIRKRREKRLTARTESVKIETMLRNAMANNA